MTGKFENVPGVWNGQSDQTIARIGNVLISKDDSDYVAIALFDGESAFASMTIGANKDGVVSVLKGETKIESNQPTYKPIYNRLVRDPDIAQTIQAVFHAVHADNMLTVSEADSLKEMCGMLAEMIPDGFTEKEKSELMELAESLQSKSEGGALGDQEKPTATTDKPICSDVDVEKTIQECGANLLTLDPSEIPSGEEPSLKSTPLQPKDGQDPVKLF